MARAFVFHAGIIADVPNPFTRALTALLRKGPLPAFIADWDALEALVIRVFRAKQATPEDQQAYLALSEKLRASYPALAPALDKHWRAAKMAGDLATEDPFLLLLGTPDAHTFVGNWRAMTALPAAREALNQRVIEAQERA
jgi:hypothetical protein